MDNLGGKVTTILALSDTHLNKDGKLHSELKKLAATADLVLHAGDFFSKEAFAALYEECGGKLLAVCGDLDEDLKYPNEKSLRRDVIFGYVFCWDRITSEIEDERLREYLTKEFIGIEWFESANIKKEGDKTIIVYTEDDKHKVTNSLSLILNKENTKVNFKIGAKPIELVAKMESGTRNIYSLDPSDYINKIPEDGKALRIYLVNDIVQSNDMDMAEDKYVDLLIFGHNDQPLIVWGKKEDNSKKSRMLVCPGSSSPFYHSSHSAVLLDVNDGKISRAKMVRIPITYQVGWRRCKNCKSLFWGPGADKSVCPKGGKHAIDEPNQYCLAHNDPNAFGQAKWRWCKSCQSLFFAPKSEKSICPATNKETHKTFSESGDYTIILNYPKLDPKVPGEGGWRLCKNCSGLFFAVKGTNSGGVCPNISTGNRAHVSDSDKNSNEYQVEVR